MIKLKYFNSVIFVFTLMIVSLTNTIFAGCTNPPAPIVAPASGINCNGTCLNFASSGGSTTSLIIQYDDNAGFTSPTQVVEGTTSTQICVTAPAGTTVYWRIRAVDCTGPCTCYSAYTSGASVVIPACPATSDNCAGAIAMAFQPTGSGAWTCSTTTGATASAEANPACWTGNTLEDVWYRVTISGTNLLVTTDQSNTTGIDSQVAIYSSCGAAAPVSCSMDAFADYANYYETTTGATALATGLTSGNTYYIRVDGDAAVDGFFCLKATGVPTNNCYGSATALTAGVSVNGSTYGASEDCDGVGGTSDCDLGGSNSVIDCGPGGGASIENNVWYTVPCATSGTYTVNLTSVSCNGTNGLQVWGSLTNATCSGYNAQSNDGTNGEFCINTASVSASMSGTFTCTAGQTARFTVDGFAAEMCSFGVSFTAPVPMPVELISFEAAYLRNQVGLTWVTNTERENDYFIIERSSDGNTFYEVNRIDGAGNSLDKNVYTYYERPRESEDYAYYRLKQVDLNNTINDLGTRFVNFDRGNTVMIVPNPTSLISDIVINTKQSEEVNVMVQDYNGKVILAHDFKSVEGDNRVPVNLESYSEGVYYVSVTSNSKTFKTKLIKLID